MLNNCFTNPLQDYASLKYYIPEVHQRMRRQYNIILKSTIIILSYHSLDDFRIKSKNMR